MGNNGFVDRLVKSVLERRAMLVDEEHQRLHVVFVIGNDGGIKHKDSLLRKLKEASELEGVSVKEWPDKPFDVARHNYPGSYYLNLDEYVRLGLVNNGAYRGS